MMMGVAKHLTDGRVCLNIWTWLIGERVRSWRYPHRFVAVIRHLPKSAGWQASGVRQFETVPLPDAEVENT